MAGTIVWFAGCTFSAPNGGLAGDGPPGPGDDVRRDSPNVDGRTVDAGDRCFGEDPFLICLTTLPTLPLVLGAATIDTSPASCTSLGGEVAAQANGPDLCVLSGMGVTLTGTYRAQGSLPLVIVSTGDLDVINTAYLDVSSFITVPPGAGSRDCVPSSAAGSDNNGGGGGAGGSFGTSGGIGGRGPMAPGKGATPGGTESPTRLAGGCSGSNGGNASGGAPGAGGGAVYLVAAGTLTIAGTIDASGEGGRGAASGKNGGGGGGAGGMIALYGKTAITIDPAAKIFANGAGGGAGSDSSAGGNGKQSTAPTDQAAGGTNGAANGGAGAIAGQSGAPGTNSSKGGGGGGGGVGVIKNVSGQTLGSGMFSPAPS